MAASSGGGGGSGCAPSSPPAEAWQVEHARALPELEAIDRSMPPPWPLRVLRSSQLDAQRLDAELSAMLQEQFMSAFQLFQPGRVSRLEPELHLALSLLVFWLSVWRGRASPGSELMNLRYRDERAMEAAAAAAACGVPAGGAGQQGHAPALARPPWLHGGRSGVEGPGLSLQQRVGYGALFVAGPYLWLRANRLAAQLEWGQRRSDGGGAWGAAAWRLLRRVDAAHKAAALLNQWVFLCEGKYRTLGERVLGARLVYRQGSMSRLVSFEYLNRQLVWQELSEFLLFLLPLINVAKLRRAVLRLLPRVPAAGGDDGGGGEARSALGGGGAYPRAPEPQQARLEAEAEAGGGPAKPVGPCPICGVAEVLVPFVALPCRHVFCYYCLRGHCEADREFACPLDGQRVEALQRLARRVAAQ